jgi:hypothetical protein
MAWIDERFELSGWYVAAQYYFERRQKPGDPTKEQIRKRFLLTFEFLGGSLQAVQDFVQNGATVQTGFTQTRSYYAIGGGGYTAVDSTDQVRGDWEDLPEYIPPQSPTP